MAAAQFEDKVTRLLDLLARSPHILSRLPVRRQSSVNLICN